MTQSQSELLATIREALESCVWFDMEKLQSARIALNRLCEMQKEAK